MTTITDTLTPSERALETERDIEAAKLRAHRTQTQRAQGVRWSGMEPEQFPERNVAKLVEAAKRRVEREAAYKLTKEAEYRNTYAEARDNVKALYGLLEALNDAFNRNDGSTGKAAGRLKDIMPSLAGSVFALISDCDGAEFERGRK